MSEILTVEYDRIISMSIKRVQIPWLLVVFH